MPRRRLVVLLAAVTAAWLVASPAGARAATPLHGHLLAIEKRGDDVLLLDAHGRTVGSTGIRARYDVSYSPDGRQAVFSQATGGQVDGYPVTAVMIRDASGRVHQVSRPGEFAYDPAWSPNGQLIAYEGGAVDERINLVRPDGTGHRVLPATVNSNHPSWSPDSKRLAYFTFDGDATHLTRLFTTSVAGGRPRQLAAPFLARFAAPNLNRSPSWSPDGRLIAFVVGPTRLTSTVAVVSPEGTGARVIDTRDAGVDNRPLWVSGRRLVVDHATTVNGRAHYSVDLLDLSGHVRVLFTRTGFFTLVGYVNH